MNWRRLYATLEIGVTTGLFSMFISAFFCLFDLRDFSYMVEARR